MTGEAMRKIGEVAEATGLSIRTLRHYDDLGLVVPSGHTSGGFRLYTNDDVERLLLVRRMKPLGFSLERMRQFHRRCPASDDLVDPPHGTANAAAWSPTNVVRVPGARPVMRHTVSVIGSPTW